MEEENIRMVFENSLEYFKNPGVIKRSVHALKGGDIIVFLITSELSYIRVGIPFSSACLKKLK